MIFLQTKVSKECVPPKVKSYYLLTKDDFYRMKQRLGVSYEKYPVWLCFCDFCDLVPLINSLRNSFSCFVKL